VAEEVRVRDVLYVEEAHIFIGDFESLLAKCRKYRLVLALATQGIESLPKEAASAVFANCATPRVLPGGRADAERLPNEFATVMPAAGLQNPGRLQGVRPHSRAIGAGAGTPSRPTMVATHPPFAKTVENVAPDAVQSRINSSSDRRTAETPRLALKFSSPDAFHAHRCAELRACTSRWRAGCFGPNSAIAAQTLLRITVSSLFRSCAAADATAHARSARFKCSINRILVPRRAPLAPHSP